MDAKFINDQKHLLMIAVIDAVSKETQCVHCW